MTARWALFGIHQHSPQPAARDNGFDRGQITDRVHTTFVEHTLKHYLHPSWIELVRLGAGREAR